MVKLLPFVPPGAHVDHVEDFVAPDEHDVAFNNFVELVNKRGAALIVVSRLLPFTTNSTGLHDFWNESEHEVVHAYPIEEFGHSVCLCMPPTYMQFPQGEAYGRLVVCPEESYDSANIKLSPVVGSSAGADRLVGLAARSPLSSVGASALAVLTSIVTGG